MNILERIEALIASWQLALGENGQNVDVVLGGSLVSGLFIFDEETTYIDVDVRFLVDHPEDKRVREKIEMVTGLTYRKTITVGDWPEGTSTGVMVEGQKKVSGISLPLDIEGCIRSRKYIGWAKFYRAVLTEQELAEFRKEKAALRHNKAAYKKLKSDVRAEVERRCIERGLV